MADADPKKPADETKPDTTGPAPAAPPLPPAPPPAVNDNATPPAETAPGTIVPVPALPAVPPVPASPEQPPVQKAQPAFKTKAIIVESKDHFAYPRSDAKENGFEKALRFFGLGDFVDAARQPRNKAHHIGQAVTSKIGFGEIYRAACQPQGKVKGTLKALGSKIADMLAGRVVSGSFKLIAITFVAGMIGGVSGWGSICLLALATGASSGIYNYGKNYVTDKLAAPKSQRGKVKLFDLNRAKDAGKAFLSGTANGAFGAWLAKLPIFQAVMKHLHDTIHHGMGQISKPFDADQTSSSFSQRISAGFNRVAGRRPKVPFVPALRPAAGPSFG